MGRPAKFDRERLLDAAVGLVAEGGPSALTVAALARATGAPTGSIYHRFPSMDLLAGEAWVRSVERFQVGFVAALEGDDTRAAGLAAACHTPRWARAHLAEARLLLLHRHEDLMTRFPDELGERMAARRLAGLGALRAYVRRHFGRATPAAMAAASFALIDVPYGAVRRHLTAGRAPPVSVDALVERASAAVLADPGTERARAAR